MVPPELLEMLDHEGFTPLSTAATSGAVSRIAECMVNKNINVLSIPISTMSLPVTLAFASGHKQMGRYLYFASPPEIFKPENGIQGPKFLRYCFFTKQLDITLDLLQRYKDLLYAKDNRGWSPIMCIAVLPFVLFSGNQLVFWKRWICNYINIQSSTPANFVHVDIEQQDGGNTAKGLGLVRRFISKAHYLLGMMDIYEEKWVRSQAAQIFSLVCKNVSVLVKETDEVEKALFQATREGNVEFVVRVTKAYPILMLAGDCNNKNWNIFSYAIAYRQAEVFNLIHGIRSKDRQASWADYFGNTLLHVAANVAPPAKLNRIAGPALQMQTELRFKEVESLVFPWVREFQNSDGMKPKDIFKQNHKELRKEGEKWMKGTASSCSVVGALVVTIMFAAAFTVLGGNDQTSGFPIFLDKQDKLFMIFIFSDVISLFSSTTSVLMFLGILTSRYKEEDFLKSLPTKLIIGLSTLFLLPFLAFSATILMMLQHRSYLCGHLPIIILASVPVAVFGFLQFPLLLQMVSSTYGPGIFNRKVKPWL